MRTQKFELALLTPAFLGDAHQSGAWRTPPFKALLREWWRIAAAPAHRFDQSRLRENEGHLFGNAWLDSGATKSKIRLTLGAWRPGQLRNWQNDQPVFHPAVGHGGRNVGSQLYLGYGPLEYSQHATALKKNAALQAGETNTLSLAWPEGHDAILTHTLQLIDWFGTVGGRSRNGWGSVALGGEALRKDHPLLNAVLRDLDDCLRLDWPHAIGRDDEGPLVWQSRETFADWKAAMLFLAKTKIGFLCLFPFSNGRPHPNERKRRNKWLLHDAPQDRHLLSYPVTHHDVRKQLPKAELLDWGEEARLANQLRFKLYRDGERLRARIYHTPHACPLPVHGIDQAAVWKRIHAWLGNSAHGLERLGGQQ